MQNTCNYLYRDKPVTPDEFMSAIKSVTEDPETKRLFDLFAEDEGKDTSPMFRVVSEFGHFLAHRVQFYMPQESAVELAEHIQSNPITRKYAEKYGAGMTYFLYNMAGHIKDSDKLSVLAALEKDKNFLPPVIRNSQGDFAADFFVQMREGMSDDLAVARFRASRAFQAGAENSEFIDYLNAKDPVLLGAISSGIKNTHDFTR
ncbi:MAG: hypothetical protein OEY94_05550 [Alphaproteobacteria bacterium]|nr:hypothetical protein [Alphaproteobacteria bacterium]